MKRALALGFVLALVSSSFAACTLDFDQFKPGAGGNGTGGAGTGGSTTSVCNGGCCTAGDCPTPQDPCKVATCDANTCGEKAQADGSEVSTQTPGDCKKAVCQGGQVMNNVDTTDVLDDGNACTIDSCSADGAPQTMPAGAGTACNSDGGTVCDAAGKCVECLVNGNCAEPAKPVCDPATHTCISASCGDGMKNGQETDTDCGGGQCPPCDTGKDCQVNTDCASQKCGAGNKCSAPKCDDQIKNGDETDVDCGGSCNGCGPGQGCNVNGDCIGDACTGMNGTCAPSCSDLVLNNGESDVDCGGANCDKCGLGKECAGLNTNCQSDLCDANSKCANKDPNGTMCASGATCASGNCTDGVCCASACQGFCRACNLMGSVGTCINIPSGQDPANECNGTDTCDGQGGCGTPNGLTCANGGDCISGNCVDGVCCNSSCNTTCKACNLAGSMGTCTNIPAGQDPSNECAMSSCNGSGACNKALGVACGAAGECDSGFCTDGVCCADTCQGLCKACNVAGSLGTCTFVPNGTDPANECNGAQNNCDGAGACTN